MMTEGMKTSEFWVTIATMVVIVGLLIAHGSGRIDIPAEIREMLWMALIPPSTYAVSRGMAKGKAKGGGG